ncbi:MAG: UDP-N-acetylmuramate--alanine ligase, partial [Burkholderiales bacterium]
MTRGDSGAKEQMRERIAHQAARIIAEDGVTDFGAAKRKAARQLGAPGSRNLPGNEEIESALIRYQALYHAGEHQDRLASLRALARDSMRLFEHFRPQLVGGLVTGSIGRHSGIQLHLY